MHTFIQGFLFYVSELKRLEKIIVMLYLCEHFHQKIRQRAIVVAVTTSDVSESFLSSQSQSHDLIESSHKNWQVASSHWFASLSQC